MLTLFVLLLQAGELPTSIERVRDALNRPATALASVSSRTPVQQAAAVTLTLRIADGRRTFRPGEIIPIALEFNSAIPKRFAVDGATYDRSGRLTVDEFRIEPIDAVTDPMLDYFAGIGGVMGGGIRGFGVLGEKPYVIELALNDWFRFDTPGTYRLSIRSTRVTDELAAIPRTRAVVPVESNTISFEILPRDERWEADAFNEALRLLNAGTPDANRRMACRILRFLGTDAAVTEMIDRFADRQPGCEFDFIAGLFNGRNRARAVHQMEARLQAADFPVSHSYLRTLARLSVYVQHPELRPAQTRENKGRMIIGGESSARQDLVKAAEASYMDLLVAALPHKTDRARALTVTELVEAAPGGAVGRDLGRQLASVFLDLPLERQISLLQYYWRSLAGAEMLPILRRLVEQPRGRSLSAADIALRRLYELSPAEGRAIILREIANPRPDASLKTLGLLPDRELPELDDVLASNLDPKAGFEPLSIRAELLHRYASPRVASRVLSQVSDLLPRLACRPLFAFLAYFLRADAALGKTQLDRALAQRTMTGCYRSMFDGVAALRMTPALEETAIAHLVDPDPEVVGSAIKALGTFGSSAAREPLRWQFMRWHEQWTGRPEAVRHTQVADLSTSHRAMVESAYIDALGRARGWLTSKSELAELRSLCVSDNCRMRADQISHSADSAAIRIFRANGADDWFVQLAQYDLYSLAALEEKLAQFPDGTSFTIDTGALSADAAATAVADITKAAAARRLSIRK